MAQQLPLIDTRTETDGAAGPAVSSGAVTPGGRARTTRSTPARLARVRATRAYAVRTDRPGTLIEIPPADWHIDQHTKEVGLAGVAAARRALADAVGRAPHPHGDRSAA